MKTYSYITSLIALVAVVTLSSCSRETPLEKAQKELASAEDHLSRLKPEGEGKREFKRAQSDVAAAHKIIRKEVRLEQTRKAEAERQKASAKSGGKKKPSEQTSTTPNRQIWRPDA